MCYLFLSNHEGTGDESEFFVKPTALAGVVCENISVGFSFDCELDTSLHFVGVTWELGFSLLLGCSGWPTVFVRPWY
jgi:hypothetical protein